MATVVRVKRRCEDEPIEAFILNCKRRKISSDIEPLCITVFKFAETLEKDVDISSQLDTAKYDKDLKKVKDDIKKHTVNINDKLRNEHKESSKKNRFKIVSHFRSQTENIYNSENTLNKSITVLDLENDLEGNSDLKSDSQDQYSEKFVYDLYYNCSGQVKDNDVEYLSVQPIHDYFGIESLVDNNDLSSDNESEDSNAENNERNEYPDESDVESIDENDMLEAMENVNIHDDLLSSDYDEDDYIWGEEDKISDADMWHSEKFITKFKAKYKEELDSDTDDFSE